jgi:predicted ribosome quality control (RQC) complex YloA/Tae2 family protein
MKYLKIDEFDVILGESAKDNDELITMAKKRDQNSWWLHLKNVASAHLVIFAPDVKDYLPILKELILSKTRKAPKSQHLIYTRIKNVTKTDTLGSVNVKHEMVFK